MTLCAQRDGVATNVTITSAILKSSWAKRSEMACAITSGAMKNVGTKTRCT